MATTVLENVVNPQVLADMVSAELSQAIKFSAIAPIDDTLEGQAGSTISIPQYGYIGDATVIAEGTAIPYSALSTSMVSYTIYKVAKGVEITDEVMLSGYGDPQGEAAKQIAMAIASAIDNKTLEAINTGTLEVESAIDANLIDAIETAFDTEEGETGVLFVNPKDFIKLRKAYSNFFERASDLGDSVLVSGVMGRILGWDIVRTKKVAENNPRAVRLGACKTYLKRDFLPEVGRDMDKKTTKFNADKHLVVALEDNSKVIKVKPKA